MKQLEAHIVGFDRGIVENIRQNTQFSNPMNSILWISNYNPNLENFTGVMRSGVSRINDYDNEELPVANLTRTGVERPESIAFDTSIDLHDVDVLEVTQPEYNKLYAIFITELVGGDPNIKNTLVEAYVKRWTGPATIQKRWYNAIVDFIEGVGNIVGKGREVPGIFSDKARYGETYLFTTLLPELREDLLPAPVYQYKHIDLYSLIRENKLLKFPTDQVYQLPGETEAGWSRELMSNWIVKKSSLDLSSGINARLADKDTEVDVDTLNFTNNEDIIVIFKEVKLGQLDTGDYDSWMMKVNADIKHFHGEEEKEIYLDTPSAISCTIDIPKFPVYESDLKDVVAASNGLATIVESQYAEVTISDNPEESHMININTPFFRQGKRFRVYDQDQVEENRIATQQDTALHYVVNYLNLELPRIWTAGETIPFILTAMINGVEQIIYSDKYTVQNNYNSLNSDPSNYVIASNDYAFAFFSGYLNWLDVANHKAVINGDWTFHHDGIRVFIPGMVPISGLKKRDSGTLFLLSPQINTSAHIFNEVGNSIFINIAISDNFMQELLQREVSEIKLYVTECKDESYLRSINAMKPNTPPGKYYGMPKVREAIKTNNTENIDLTQFRLVKSYLINGDTTAIDYKSYRGEPTRTNAWAQQGNEINEIYYIPIPTIDSNDIDSGKPDEELQGNIYGGTPDFLLWDYPVSQPLILNGSAKYWNSTGAKLVEVIQGRTFLAGTMNKYNVEETGKVRYSIAIGGNISPDLFYEEDYLIIGHLPLTAMIMFREQAIWFNREEFYRIIFPNIADPTTWEYLDAEKGQGTFSQKTICSTPYGICFANESGIWMTDGGKAQSITDVPDQGIAITGIYQSMALGVNQNQDISLANVNDVLINAQLGYNPYMELIYDSMNDELIVQSMSKKRNDLDSQYIDKNPVDVTTDDIVDMNTNLRLIFSFRRKNWRAEEYTAPDFDLLNPDLYARAWFNVPTKGKTAFADPEIHQSVLFNAFSNYNLSIVNPKNTLKVDTYTKDLVPAVIEDDEKDIIGEIVTHEIGDGKQDQSLHSVLAECTAYDTSYSYNIHTILNGAINDPFLGYELRNRETQYDNNESDITEDALEYTTPTATQRSGLYWEDLFRLNFLTKGANQDNPFYTTMQTPPLTAVPTTYGVKGVVRESFSLLAPLRTHSRRMRFRWISKRVNKIKSFVLKVIVHKRRAY